MTDLMGSFYLKQTNSGNLHGEFINDTPPSNGPYPESAMRVNSAQLSGKLSIDIIGTYESVWKEAFNKTVEASLTISRPSSAYKLIWKDKNGLCIFKGEGFIHDGLLSGYYKQIP